MFKCNFQLQKIRHYQLGHVASVCSKGLSTGDRSGSTLWEIGARKFPITT